MSPLSNLISSDRVAGTEVYNHSGDHLGEIHEVMIDKISGKVAYAIMSFGGFLGMGESYHPLPWSSLKFDTTKGGYVVNLTKDQLKDAPSYEKNASPKWGDRNYENDLHTYYGSTPYWTM